MKTAVVFPLLKKLGLDPNDLSNYRPVSNLIYLSKSLERSASDQLNEYFTTNSLLSPFQSAYRAGHSVETSVLYISNSIRQYLDIGKSVILVLLDLSAAFDTIDHSILLSRLHTRFGIVGDALSWIESYLSNRHYIVQVGSHKSSPHCLNYGVPQGSVLGPLLFSAYTSPITDVINAHGIQHHLYADDTQLWVPVDVDDPTNLSSTLKTLTLALNDISSWMTRNKLKLNPAKTELVIITSKFRRNPLPDISLTLHGSTITPVATTRNLGILFDSHFTFKNYISQTIKSGYYHLRNIKSISKYLTTSQCETLVHAFVTSKIDNCNSILININKKEINRIQKLQNSCARLITKANHRQHMTPILASLHWLPVQYRIQFKPLLFAFKCIHNLAPSYLSSALTLMNSRNTRQAKYFTLIVPRFKQVHFGDCTFSRAASTLFNSLPSHIRLICDIRAFKSQVKTHLFAKAFT